MTANNEHFIISPETTRFTWVTPALALPVIKGKNTIGRATIDTRETGGSRHIKRQVQGAKAPGGSVELYMYPDHLGKLLKALGFDITTSTPGGATNARDHGLLVGASPLLATLSAQFKRGTAKATNLLGVTFDKLTIKATKGELVTMALDFLCKDEAPVGGTWDHDGSSSPAIVATPTYISASLSPYVFFKSEIKIGGTPSLDGTTKLFSLAGATVLDIVESLEIVIQNNLEQSHYLTDDPTPGQITAQNLDVTVQMDIDMSSLPETYYNYVRNGTQVPFSYKLTGADIESGQPYLFNFFAPGLKFNEGDLPEISGDQKRRIQTISGLAVEDSATGHAVGIHLRDTQTAY